MKKTLRIFLSSLSLTALLAGPTIALAESSSSESSASSQESTASSESSTDFKAVAEAIKAATSAKEASVTYTNSTPITFGKAPVTETIHAYSLISLKDFTKDLAIPFGGDTQTGAWPKFRSHRFRYFRLLRDSTCRYLFRHWTTGPRTRPRNGQKTLFCQQPDNLRPGQKHSLAFSRSRYPTRCHPTST